jgi:hypothetical protein
MLSATDRTAIRPSVQEDGAGRIDRGPPAILNRQGWRRLAGRLFLLTAGLMVPLLAFELLLRIGGAVAPGEYQTTGLTASSDVFSRENIPNRAGSKQSSEFRSHVRVNSKGLRGPEIPYERSPGVLAVEARGLTWLDRA